jgi:hypothetical protein
MVPDLVNLGASGADFKQNQGQLMPIDTKLYIVCLIQIA